MLEPTVRDFNGYWTGTGSIENSGDTERLVLGEGQQMTSEVVYTGTLTVTLLYNVYRSGDTATMKFRHGATEGACLAATFEDYSVPFDSLGYVQVRMES